MKTILSGMKTVLRIFWPFIIIGIGAGAAYLVVTRHKPHDTTVQSVVPAQKAQAATTPKETAPREAFDVVKKDWSDHSIVFMPGNAIYIDVEVAGYSITSMAEFTKKHPTAELQLLAWTDGSKAANTLAETRIKKLSDDLDVAGVKHIKSLGEANYSSKDATAAQVKKADTVEITLSEAKQ